MATTTDPPTTSGAAHQGLRLAARAGTALVLASATLASATPANAAENLCATFDVAPVGGGEVNAQNNNYGEHGKQCITTTKDGFTVDVADGEIAPGGAPKSYPSLVAGCHWGRCSTTTELPVKASEVGGARTGVSIETAPGSWNAAYDIWFHPTPTTDGQNTGTELMIWINSNDAPDPIGKPVGQVTLDGASWTVYLGNIGWDVISFVRDEPATTVDLPLEPFVAEAMKRGATDPEDWMTSVQFGFEPWSGGKGLAAKNFTYQPDGEAPKSSAEIRDEIAPDTRASAAGGRTVTGPEATAAAPKEDEEQQQQAPALEPSSDAGEPKDAPEQEPSPSTSTSAPVPAAPATDETTTEPGEPRAAPSGAPTTAPSTGEDTRSAREREPAATSKDTDEKAAPQPAPARPEATSSATSSTEGEEPQPAPTDARQTPTQEEAAAPSAPARTAEKRGEDGDAAEKETTSETQRESAAAGEKAPSAGEDPGENPREGAAPSDELPVTAPLKPGLPPEPGEASPSSDVGEKKETEASTGSGHRKWWQLWLIAGEDSSAAEQAGPDTGTDTSETASTGEDTGDTDSAQPMSPEQTRPTTSPTGAQQKEKETKEEEGTETHSPAPNGDEASGYEESALADDPVMLLTGEAGGEAMADVVDPDREITAHGQSAPATTPDGGAGIDLDGRSDYLEVDGKDLSIADTGQLTVEILMRPDKVKDLAATEGSSEGPMVHVLNKGSKFGKDGDQEWTTRVYDEDSKRPSRVSNYAFRPEGGQGAGSYDQSGLKQGEWVVATAVYDTTTQGKDGWGTVTMYRDGKEVDTDSLGSKYPVTPTDGGAPLFVGGGADDGRFDGAIGAVAIYPTALPDSAIAAHASAALGTDAPAGEGTDESKPADDGASGTAAGKGAGTETSRPMPTEAAAATAGKSASEDGASS